MKKRLLSLITVFCLLSSTFVFVTPAHADYGWILESELPRGAEVTARKWTYDEPIITTSDKTSLPGWEQCGIADWKWGSWGDWSSWSDTKRTQSDSRQVETRKVDDTKKVKSYNYYRYSDAKLPEKPKGTSGNDEYNKSHPNKYTYKLTSELTARTSTIGTGSGSKGYKYVYNGTNYISVWKDSPFKTYAQKTQYRYRDREKVYTYYYRKYEHKESYTEPAGTDIINKTAWVMYRYLSFTLDLNGCLNDAYSGSIDGFGTADVYINGVLAADDVSDFYNTYVFGTRYDITDIKAFPDRTYVGVHSGSLSGTIENNVSVELQYYVNPIVRYDANGGSGAPAEQSKTYGQKLTLRTEVPTRKGYTFIKWTSQANGAGDPYYPGGIYPENINSDMTLYAQWQPNEFIVRYNGNGSTQGLESSSTHTYDGTSYFASNQFSRKGYSFQGWALNKDAAEIDFAPDSQVPNLVEVNQGEVTVYAVWKPNTYTVHYDGNGGFIYDENGEIMYDQNNSPVSMEDSVFTYDSFPITLSPNLYKRKDYEFKGWATENRQNAVEDYDDNENIDTNLSEGKDVTLYAVWKEIPHTNDVVFEEKGFYGGKQISLKTTTSNANIYYTLDGSEPSLSSSVYTGPLEFKTVGDTTIKAFALKEGNIASNVTEYTVSVKSLEKVQFDISEFEMGKKVRLYLDGEQDGKDYKIYYTQDGKEPSDKSAAYNGEIMFNVKTNAVVKAFAVKKGFISSEVSAVSITVDSVATPVVEVTDSWPGGALISIKSDTKNSKIYYTTDQTDPKISSTRQLYSEEFEVTVKSNKPENITIRAVAMKNGYAVSEVMKTITITDREVYEPYMTINNVIGGKMISLGCETEKVEIFYTDDGTDASTTSRPYHGEFMVSEDVVIKAIAVYDSRILSPQMEKEVTVPKMLKPTINVEVGEDSSVVVISGNSTNSTIFYTLDGSMPNERSLKYEKRFEVTQKTTIRAIAARKGYATSDPAEAEAIVFTLSIPEVNTMDPSGVTEYGAVLHGEFLAGEDSDITSRRFIYYEKNNFRSVNTVEADDTFSAVISNLKPDTEYWYQAMAENRKGIGTGLTKAFKTNKVSVQYPTSIKISPEFVSMNKGEKRAVLATVLPKEAINRKLAWSSSDRDIATVNNNGVVTAVSSGTAVITATSASGKVKGTMQVAVIDGTINGELDFSEISMAKNISELWNKNNSPDTYKVDGVLLGGNSVMATAYLARWGGTVLEERDPYPDGIQSMNVKQYSSDYHVQEVLFLPPRRDALDNDDIKKAIMEHGAVYSEFQYDSNYIKYEKDKKIARNYYLADKDSHNARGHALAIVGWDDNYSRNKFKVDYRPEGNGAFICKNSWGTSNGEDGYIYISYYDPYIGRQGVNAVFNNLESNSNYNTIYQYDPLGPILSRDYPGGQVYISNVFPKKGETLAQDELLRAVSFYTGDKGYTYEIFVIPEFTDSAFFDNIGSCVKRGVMEYAGYHTVKLDEAINLKKGTRFAVIVRLSSVDGKVSTYFEAPLEEMAAHNASAEEGESFVSTDGITWSDVHLEMLADTNVCVKAFTDRQDEEASLMEAIKPVEKESQTVSMYEAIDKGFVISQGFIDEVENAVLFDDNSDDAPTGAITPSIEIGNNAVDVAEGAVFDEKFDLRNQGHSVSAVKDQGSFNTCWAFATYASLESCVMRNAQKIRYYDSMAGASGDAGVIYGGINIPVSKVTLNKSEVKLAKGSEMSLYAEVLPYDASDRNITWISDNPEIAQVDTSGNIRALELGTATITAINDDSGIYSSCDVVVAQAEPVSGINLPYDEIVCEVGDNIVILHEILPENAENTEVVYNVSDENVAYENDGIIIASASGQTEITVTTVDGGYQASVQLYVLEAEEEPVMDKIEAYVDKTEGGFEAEIINDNDFDIETDIYFAVYDETTNALIKTYSISDVTIGKFDSYVCTPEITVDKGCIGKLFVWEKGTLSPYIEALVFE